MTLTHVFGPCGVGSTNHLPFDSVSVFEVGPEAAAPLSVTGCVDADPIVTPTFVE